VLLVVLNYDHHYFLERTKRPPRDLRQRLPRVHLDPLNPAFASIMYQCSKKRFIVAKKLYEWSKSVSH
jgi:hypothetical protein